MTVSTDARDHIIAAQKRLEEARNLLSAEIMGYPKPVAAGDTSHAHLLERHKQVSAALAALSGATRSPMRGDDA